MDHSLYQYMYIRNKYHRRRIGSVTWRKLCLIKNCYSISKGLSGKCIKHQQNNMCDSLNCKKRLKNNMYRYCDKHINSKEEQKFTDNKSDDENDSIDVNVQDNNVDADNVLDNNVQDNNVDDNNVEDNNVDVDNVQDNNVEDNNVDADNVLDNNVVFNKKICNYWVNYYIDSDNNVSTKCQSICCSFYMNKEKPDGKFCNIENKFFCNLCSVF